MKHLTKLLHRLASELFIQRWDKCEWYDTKKVEYKLNYLPSSTTFFNNCITTNGLETNSKWLLWSARVDWLVFSAIYHHHYWTTFTMRDWCVSLWDLLTTLRVHDSIKIQICHCMGYICVLVLCRCFVWICRRRTSM
jgi:hypothetical protein